MSARAEPSGIAIIGMGCAFPGAPDLPSFWRNIESGVDSIRDVPMNRWEPVFYDPDSDAVDRLYCRRGGFLEEPLLFDAASHGLMPVAARGAEPDQLVALEVATRALADAGYPERPLPRERTGIVLGRGNYIGAGMTRLEQHVRTAEQLVSSLRDLLPGLSEGRVQAVKAEFQSRLGAYGPDTAINLVPNLTASLIANRLDLQGPAYTLDAACASTLIAVDRACEDLLSARIDLGLAGGVHLTHDVAFWSVFCRLGALSRRGEIRPFDQDADGLLIGEGVGIVVLKRLADAQRDGDRIYAVIRGIGVGSDGRGTTIMTPSSVGQELALRRAWTAACIDPDTVGLVEAHGTGTPVGDAVEVETLHGFFGPLPEGRRRPVIGSVKSMIGHAMPAAGAAGLIKAALCLFHRVLPPTLHCENPLASLRASRFRTLRAAEEWERDHFPRRAALNAFGFGGINAHVVLEEHSGQEGSGSRVRERLAGIQEAEELLWLAREEVGSLAEALRKGHPPGGRGPYRVALVDPTPERRAHAAAVVESGRARRGRDGLWFTPEGLVAQGGRIAFLYPGVEAHFAPRVGDVARLLGRTLPSELEAEDLERKGSAVVAVGRILTEALALGGVRPDLVAGHSIGEWSGMIAAGMIAEDVLEAFLDSLELGSLEVPSVVFASVGAGLDAVGPLLSDLDRVVVSHDNCPHQVVVCGEEASVDEAMRRLAEAKVLAQKLPFQSGFHAPFLAPYLDPHRTRLRQLPLRAGEIPMWSATSCSPYPHTPEAIRDLAVEHLVRPVRFRTLTEALFEDGVRVFVQVGTGSLVGFVTDTLRGKPHLAISANVPQRPGLDQLRRVLGALFVEGVDVRWEKVVPRAGRPMAIELGVPLVRLKTPLELGPAVSAVSVEHPVLAEFEAVLREAERTSREVRAAWEHRTSLPTLERATTRRRLSVEDCPWLADHCLIPQPPGWEALADRYPVVPMTMSIRMMMDAAEALLPGHTAVAVEDVRAIRWLGVHPGVDVSIEARREPSGSSRWEHVRVSLEGFAEGKIALAPAYPAAPNAEEPALRGEGPVEMDAESLYRDGWMFHGPAYQAVACLDGIGDDGIRGVLKALPAEGALLDAAGQLFGLWVMLRTSRDRLAMPVRIGRIELFGPPPDIGSLLSCVVRIRHLGAREVGCDMEISLNGRVWARIEGWEDHRFETDDRLWPVMRRPAEHVFAEPIPLPMGDGTLALLDDRERSATGRDYLARRFLGEMERARWETMPPRGRSAWLCGRIAAKDAARHWLRERGIGSLFPVEIEIDNDVEGKPILHTPFEHDLRISIAHKPGLAVALVAEGRDPGVDIELVAPRGPDLTRLILTATERGLLPAVEGPDGDEWVTRAFAAKEAVLKARGTGLRGDPRRIVISEVSGEILRVDGVLVHTFRRGEAIIAWMLT